jgi:diaminohydroxyphosphoribosylaminopyrimidine deaminase / 5-amino-6-(5-phosphoribosylamino)uracil reductase
MTWSSARGSSSLLDRRISGVEPRFLERALELSERGRGTTHPNPIVGAVVVSGDKIVGEGWHERKGGPHAEVVALEAAGHKARGATVYVTLEPCAHHGATPPCVDALLEAGVARVVVGQRDPNPKHWGGIEKLRDAGVQTELVDRDLAFRCRQQIEEWRAWVTSGRPFVTYKVAVTLDGRVRVPGSRWVTGEASRKLVHVLRAQSDAVAVGMGTVRWDNPRLDARDVPVIRQPRRIAFGRGPLPEGSELELRAGPLSEELEALANEGVQSLLLEGGPTLAAAFLEAGFVDKLLVFVAPRISGEGPGMLEGLPRPLELSRMEARPIGEDVLLQAYVNEP